MATFKCLVSGNFVTFTNQVDIEEPVEYKNTVRTDTAFAPVIPTFRKMGRPRKEAANV